MVKLPHAVALIGWVSMADMFYGKVRGPTQPAVYRVDFARMECREQANGKMERTRNRRKLDSDRT